MIATKKEAGPYHRLKFIMNKKGVQQKDIAELIDRDISTTNQKINRSSGRDFSLSEAKKIAKYLNIKLDDFF